MQGIGDERADVVERERRQYNLLDPRSSFAERFQRPRERVRRTDFVVTVGPDQHQVLHVRIGNEVLHEFKGLRVQPLQIVEEQRERVLWPGERTEETPEHQLEAVPRVLRRQVRNGWLFANDKFQLGDELNDQLPTGTHGVQQEGPPLLHFRFALDEDLTDQSLEGLCQGSVRDVPPVLVELARRKQPANRNNRFVQFIHHGGFANAGITGYEYKFWRTLCHDPVESRQQSVDLTLPPVQLLRDQQSVRRVVRAESK